MHCSLLLIHYGFITSWLIAPEHDKGFLNFHHEVCRCFGWASDLPILCPGGWSRGSQTTEDPKGAKAGGRKIAITAFSWKEHFPSYIKSLERIALCVKQCKLRRSKFANSKNLIHANFLTKTAQFFSYDAKLPKYLGKYFFKDKLWSILAFFGKKPEGLVRKTWNLAYRPFTSCFEKS